MFISALIWLALLLVGVFSGTPIQVWALADVIPALLIGATVFERWAWRWSRLHPHVVGTPVVRGTWKGELDSMWIDPKTGKQWPKTVAYLVVEQTLTTAFVRLLTESSSSDSIVATIRRKPSGQHALYAVYLNTPRIGHRDGSPIHHGAVSLEVTGSPPARLEGEYWTDRQSRGRLTFAVMCRERADDFGAAEAMRFE